MTVSTARILSQIPAETLDWLLEPENPAVAVLTRRTLLGEPDDAAAEKLWARRNDYAPVAEILRQQRADGSWDEPSRDYQKYGGSLWQIVFLGELWADGSDERVQRAADYAFSRQKPDGSWSANPKAAYHMPCLTANVGRGLARMGWASDERIVAAVRSIAEGYERLGFLGCSDMQPYTLNGYCHMLAPKVLLFLGEVPSELWPEGTDDAQGRVRRSAARQGGLPLASRPVQAVPGRGLAAAGRGARRRARALRRRALPAHLRRQAGVDALRLPAVVQLGRAGGARGADGRGREAAR